MQAFRRLVLPLQRRLSTSCKFNSIETYRATNEPVYEYLPGSSERQALEEKLQEYDSMIHDVPIVIGDQEYHTEDVRFQVRPYDHENKLARYSYANEELLKKAIEVSQEAHRDWERRSQTERSEIFLRAADLITGKYRMDLMAATMLGQAKTIIQGEIDTACELADFYRFNVQYVTELIKNQPLNTEISDNKLIFRSLEGFWAAIAPFNFTAISGHLAGAPAFMGNVILWKPSSTAMLSSYICFKILREAGVPPGVLNFVPSSGSAFGKSITKSPLLAGINFTGSTKTFQSLWQEVAKNINEYQNYPRLIGECGGKNYHFLHSSADVESVVNGTVRSAFEYSGQKCSACSRMYVPESLWPQVKEGLLEAHKQIKLGSPVDPSSFLSAVIDDKAFARIQTYLDHAKSSNKIKVLAGGNADNSKGYFVEPTIVELSDPKDKIMQEEIFGPVLAVYPYPDEKYKDALDLVNTTSPYALTGAIYAHDQEVLDEASERLRFSAGNFYVNDKSTGSVVAQQPFGGARKSGTNDKAGSPYYLLRFASPQAIKTTKVPSRQWTYPYMQ